MRAIVLLVFALCIALNAGAAAAERCRTEVVAAVESLLGVRGLQKLVAEGTIGLSTKLLDAAGRQAEEARFRAEGANAFNLVSLIDPRDPAALRHIYITTRYWHDVAEGEQWNNTGWVYVLAWMPLMRCADLPLMAQAWSGEPKVPVYDFNFAIKRDDPRGRLAIAPPPTRAQQAAARDSS